jgi:hypothetical protein
MREVVLLPNKQVRKNYGFAGDCTTELTTDLE